MLDDDQKKVLASVRTWKDPGPPTWKQAWLPWPLLAGGVAMVVGSGIETGGIRESTGAVGGFMIGVGILALVIAGPLARRLRALYGLVQRADEAGTFAEEGPSPPD